MDILIADSNKIELFVEDTYNFKTTLPTDKIFIYRLPHRQFLISYENNYNNELYIVDVNSSIKSKCIHMIKLYLSIFQSLNNILAEHPCHNGDFIVSINDLNSDPNLMYDNSNKCVLIRIINNSIQILETLNNDTSIRYFLPALIDYTIGDILEVKSNGLFNGSLKKLNDTENIPYHGMSILSWDGKNIATNDDKICIYEYPNIKDVIKEFKSSAYNLNSYADYIDDELFINFNNEILAVKLDNIIKYDNTFIIRPSNTDKYGFVYIDKGKCVYKSRLNNNTKYYGSKYSTYAEAVFSHDLFVFESIKSQINNLPLVNGIFNIIMEYVGI